MKNKNWIEKIRAQISELNDICNKENLRIVDLNDKWEICKSKIDKYLDLLFETHKPNNFNDTNFRITRGNKEYQDIIKKTSF